MPGFRPTHPTSRVRLSTARGRPAPRAQFACPVSWRPARLGQQSPAQAVIAAVLVIGFWLWMAHGQKVVPGKKQFLGEQLYNLLRNSIARDILGHEYRKYLPYLIALFTFILVNNLFGQFFLFMFPTFSKIGFPTAWP